MRVAYRQLASGDQSCATTDVTLPSQVAINPVQIARPVTGCHSRAERNRTLLCLELFGPYKILYLAHFSTVRPTVHSSSTLHLSSQLDESSRTSRKYTESVPTSLHLHLASLQKHLRFPVTCAERVDACRNIIVQFRPD